MGKLLVSCCSLGLFYFITPISRRKESNLYGLVRTVLGMFVCVHVVYLGYTLILIYTFHSSCPLVQPWKDDNLKILQLIVWKTRIIWSLYVYWRILGVANCFAAFRLLAIPFLRFLRDFSSCISCIFCVSSERSRNKMKQQLRLTTTTGNAQDAGFRFPNK